MPEKNTHTEWQFTQNIGGSDVTLAIWVELSGLREGKESFILHCRPVEVAEGKSQKPATMSNPTARIQLIEFLAKDENDVIEKYKKQSGLALEAINEGMDTTFTFSQSYHVNVANMPHVKSQIEQSIVALFGAKAVEVENERPGTQLAARQPTEISTQWLVPKEHAHLFTAATEKAALIHKDLRPAEITMLLMRGMRLAGKNIAQLMTGAQDTHDRYPHIDPATISDMLIFGRELGNTIAGLTAGKPPVDLP